MLRTRFAYTRYAMDVGAVRARDSEVQTVTPINFGVFHHAALAFLIRQAELLHSDSLGRLLVWGLDDPDVLRTLSAGGLSPASNGFWWKRACS